MKLRRVLCGAALWGVLGWAIFCVCVICLPGCEQKPRKPQVGDVRWKDGQLQSWGKDIYILKAWRCIDRVEQSEWLGRLNAKIYALERQLACLEAGGHKWEFSGKTKPISVYYIIDDQYYFFRCSGCGKEYKKAKFEFGDREKAAMREFCDLSDEGTE